jgi:rhamnulokinase
VNGMWLIQQCMEHWSGQGHEVNLPELIAAAEQAGPPDALLDVDHPSLMLPGNMPGRINARRLDSSLPAIPEALDAAPRFASLIFHSLAARYAEVLRELAEATGEKLRCLHVVGGGARNRFLNRLTEEATGLKILPGHVESSTIGNLAIQMALFERRAPRSSSPSLEEIGRCAGQLDAARYE